eukprot:COSAG05_NODE_12835_length_452_cov_1.019830_1_plen_125_part_01
MQARCAYVANKHTPRRQHGDNVEMASAPAACFERRFGISRESGASHHHRRRARVHDGDGVVDPDGVFDQHGGGAEAAAEVDEGVLVVDHALADAVLLWRDTHALQGQIERELVRVGVRMRDLKRK